MLGIAVATSDLLNAIRSIANENVYGNVYGAEGGQAWSWGEALAAGNSAP